MTTEGDFWCFENFMNPEICILEGAKNTSKQAVLLIS